MKYSALAALLATANAGGHGDHDKKMDMPSHEEMMMMVEDEIKKYWDKYSMDFGTEGRGFDPASWRMMGETTDGVEKWPEGMLDKVAEASWKMVNLDRNFMIDEGEFRNYMYWWMDMEMMKHDPHWEETYFDKMDFDKNGYMSMEEMGMAMLVHKYDFEAIEEAMKRMEGYAKDMKMGMTRNESKAFMESYEGHDGKKDKRGKKGKRHHDDSDSDDDWEMEMGGGRIEIHMEENEDGARMSIIMEGAEKLAASVAAFGALAALY